MKIISPIYIYLPRKRGSDKKFPLNLNHYRNVHYRQNNEAKILYRQMLAPQIQALPKFKSFPLHIHYRLFPARRCDGGNIICVVDKFFCDALACYSNLPDDDLRYIASCSWDFGGYDNKQPRCEIEINQPCISGD